MIPGFNHNVVYRGKMYHIQTEDSGPKRPVIVTHLFLGGNIIATKKTDYSSILEEDDWEEIVKELMEEQHTEMLKELKNGKYDPEGPREKEEEEKTIGDETVAGEELNDVILDYLGDTIKE